MGLDSKIPAGPLADKWKNHKDHMELVAPNNRDKIDIIVVGTGLAGGSAAATLAEQGYNVKAFCYQDSPRRAHSIAAQGGINAAKNYQNDGDSIYRLFMILLKVVTTVQEKLMYIVWLKFLVTSLTSAYPKGCHLVENMVVCWITVLLVGFR